MSRTREIESIILSAKRSGESNKQVCCLGHDELLYARVFGAYKGKSKNGANCEMLSRVRLYLYHDPVRNSFSIKDSILLESYDNIRKDLKKIYTVSVMCELAEKTHAAGGEHAGIFNLLAGIMDLLNKGNIPEDYLLIQFLLRFLDYSGEGFYSQHCSSCGKENPKKNGPLFYSFSVPGILCPECRTADAVEISGGILGYIQFTITKKINECGGVRLTDNDRNILKTVLVQHVQAVNNIELKCLGAGTPI